MDEKVEKGKNKNQKDVFAEALFVGIACDENNQDCAVRFVVESNDVKYVIDVADPEHLLTIESTIEDYKLWINKNLTIDIEAKAVMVADLSNRLMQRWIEEKSKGIAFENYCIELFRSWRLTETQIYLLAAFMGMMMDKINEDIVIDKTKMDKEDMSVR